MPHPIWRFWAKIMTVPGGALKRSKLKAINNHAFRRPRDSCTECHGMPRGTLDGILRSPTALNGNKNIFYDRFGAISWLHDKIINGSFGGILGQFRWCKAPRMHYKKCRTPSEDFGGKYDRAQKRPKTVEIECYKSRFRTSSGPVQCCGISRGDIGWYIEFSHGFEQE